MKSAKPLPPPPPPPPATATAAATAEAGGAAAGGGERARREASSATSAASTSAISSVRRRGLIARDPSAGCGRPQRPDSGLGLGDVLVGVVARAHQRTGRHVLEAELVRGLLERL